jgi:hypothetical protein
MQTLTSSTASPQIPLANAVRPCFLSSAQEKEFEMIVWQVEANLWSCGVDHAWANARNLAGLSHDPEAVMRCALAGYQASKAARLSAGKGLL